MDIETLEFERERESNLARETKHQSKNSDNKCMEKCAAPHHQMSHTDKNDMWNIAGPSENRSECDKNWKLMCCYLSCRAQCPPIPPRSMPERGVHWLACARAIWCCWCKTSNRFKSSLATLFLVDHAMAVCKWCESVRVWWKVENWIRVKLTRNGRYSADSIPNVRLNFGPMPN